jgi:hypothetical protein
MEMPITSARPQVRQALKNGKSCLLALRLRNWVVQSAWDFGILANLFFFFENQWFDRCLRQA